MRWVVGGGAVGVVPGAALLGGDREQRAGRDAVGDDSLWGV
jgi:hypothetical protein